MATCSCLSHRHPSRARPRNSLLVLKAWASRTRLRAAVRCRQRNLAGGGPVLVRPCAGPQLPKIKKESPMNKISMFWANPLDPKQDATQLVFLIGFLMCVMLMWKIVLKHILED